MPVGRGDVIGLAGDLRAGEVGHEALCDAFRRVPHSQRGQARPDGDAEGGERGGERQRARRAPCRTPDRRERCGRGRRGRRRQRGDAVGERLRRALAGGRAAGGGAHRLEAPVFRRERRVSGELALELERAHRVEFAVESSAQPEHAVVGIVGHGSGFRVFASAPRARERRDITVPIGAPVASAMSR